MKYKDFSPEIWKKIKSSLAVARQSNPQVIAAFDADGTLWDTDLGEAFFQYLIDQKKVPLPPNPWEYYESLKKNDPRVAYLWLAKICKGLSLDKIREWASECVQDLKPPIFEAQKNLIQYFLDEGVKIYIVTASVKWAVEPGAHLLGLSNENVIGIETFDKDGVITDSQKGDITYREGKVKALLSVTNHKSPFFCSGNSEGDQELLALSTHLSLAVSATRPDDKLFRSESQLLKLAQQKGWESHRFVDDGTL